MFASGYWSLREQVLLVVAASGDPWILLVGGSAVVAGAGPDGERSTSAEF